MYVMQVQVGAQLGGGSGVTALGSTVKGAAN